MWTPYGDWKFGALSYYMDSAPRLNNLNVLSKDLEKRKKIFSQPSGKIILEVETIRKNFEALQVSDWLFSMMLFDKQVRKKNIYIAIHIYQTSVILSWMKAFLIAPLDRPSNLAAHFMTHFFKSSPWFGSAFSYFLYLCRIVKARLFYIISSRY